MHMTSVHDIIIGSVCINGEEPIESHITNVHCVHVCAYPCGKVHGCTMKTCGLPRITRVFPPMISADTVKKFYATALHDTLWRLAGIQFTVINS